MAETGRLFVAASLCEPPPSTSSWHSPDSRSWRLWPQRRPLGRAPRASRRRPTHAIARAQRQRRPPRRPLLTASRGNMHATGQETVWGPGGIHLCVLVCSRRSESARSRSGGRRPTSERKLAPFIDFDPPCRPRLTRGERAAFPSSARLHRGWHRRRLSVRRLQKRVLIVAVRVLLHGRRADLVIRQVSASL